ncbi:MAG: metal-dependent hydrolase, partial [Bdellovibrionota bacterium]
VSAFAGQEGIHSAEHHHYNERAVGEKMAARAERVGGFLLGFSRFGPAKMRLAITVALEHMTAIMADELFSNAAVQRDMDPEHRKLWLWHAAEETEHKAVAFDVYQMVKGGALRRSVALVVSTFFLFLATGVLTAVFLWRDGEFFKFRNLKSIGKFFFKYKFLVNIVPAWFSFFRPGFHPWQHDNSAQLFAWKQQYAVA